MSPSNGQDFENRLAALEQQVAVIDDVLKRNNQNITDSLKTLIEALLQMRDIHCELPPGCVTLLACEEQEAE